jgi:hypothetical protein
MVKIGETYKNNCGEEFIVLELVKGSPTYDYKIRFIETGNEKIVNRSNINHGSIRDEYSKNIYGIACKGCITCKTELQKKAFKRWYAMIERCYNPNSIGYKAYGLKGVEVCKDWLCFENFWNDLTHIDGYDEEKYIKGEIELDKDVKIKDNKVYSKQTCKFIPKTTNRKVKPLQQRTICANKDGKTYEFENITEFCEKFNLRQGTVRKALNDGHEYNGWTFNYKESVNVRKVTEWKEVLNAARFTVNKDDIDKEPSDNFKAKVLLAEHSPIRMLTFEVSMYDIPSWVSQHIARHDAFAYHTVREGALDTHFVGTQRTDRTGIDRNKLPQDAPVNHRIYLNAQDLMTISRKRLCRCASKETRNIWNEVKMGISKIEPILSDKMCPECVYRGFCPEQYSCGYVQTEAFKKELETYRKTDYSNK